MVKLFIVVPEGAVFEVTEVIAVGASVAVEPPFPPQNMPKLEFDEPDVEVIELILPFNTLPFRMQFLMVLLSALVTAVEVAIRITEFAIAVVVFVLLTVRSRLVPGVFGLSPSIVTLSAPFNCITPNPVAGFPEIETASTVGLNKTEVYRAEPAPLLLSVAGVVPSVVFAVISIVTAP